MVRPTFIDMNRETEGRIGDLIRNTRSVAQTVKTFPLELRQLHRHVNGHNRWTRKLTPPMVLVATGSASFYRTGRT